MNISTKVMTEFICKLINKPVFDYSFEANLKVLPCLFYINVHKVNFSGLYKGFNTFENGVFIILLLIISIVIEPVFVFIFKLRYPMSEADHFFTDVILLSYCC